MSKWRVIQADDPYEQVTRAIPDSLPSSRPCRIPTAGDRLQRDRRIEMS
jgi:hypothetical protein